MRVPGPRPEGTVTDGINLSSTRRDYYLSPLNDYGLSIYPFDSDPFTPLQCPGGWSRVGGALEGVVCHPRES